MFLQIFRRQLHTALRLSLVEFVLLLSLCGSAAISVAFIKGIELGKDVGRCEAACEISGGTFIALDDDDLCQCQSNGSIKWVYGVSSEFSH